MSLSHVCYGTNTVLIRVCIFSPILVLCTCLHRSILWKKQNSNFAVSRLLRCYFDKQYPLVFKLWSLNERNSNFLTCGIMYINFFHTFLKAKCLTYFTSFINTSKAFFIVIYRSIILHDMRHHNASYCEWENHHYFFEGLKRHSVNKQKDKKTRK